MKVHILDGHPANARLVSHLLDVYAAALGEIHSVTRTNVRELVFDPNLRAGYAAEQRWEPDLEQLAQQLKDCNHLVVGFPLWWGSEPAQLKGLLDRLLLPGFAFQYRRDNPLWDRLLQGRSADVIITMDTPPWYLRAGYGDPVSRRWKGQVLGFCGFKPVRIHRFGPTRRGAAQRSLPHWERTLSASAQSVTRR